MSHAILGNQAGVRKIAILGGVLVGDDRTPLDVAWTGRSIDSDVLEASRYGGATFPVGNTWSDQRHAMEPEQCLT